MAYSVSDACKMLDALRHRGPDTEGIGRRNGSGIDVIRSYRDTLSEQAYKSILGGSGGFMDTGFPIVLHTKYTTVGPKNLEEVLMASHPHRIGGNDTVYNRHTVTRNARKALAHNGQVETGSVPYQFPCSTGCDTELLMLNDDVMGPERLVREIEDTYCVVSLSEKEECATVYRDRHGRMPLWLGKDKDGNFIVSSEDYAIRQIGGIPLREVRPGEVIRMYKDWMESKQVLEPDPLYCFVQNNYMAKKHSYLLEGLRDAGIDLVALRSMLGVQTAKEIPPEAWVRFVTYIPNTPLDAAKAYAAYHGLPFVELFYKTRDIRSFMQLDQDERLRVIRSILHVNDKITPELFGNDYMQIDDTTIRGTNVSVATEKARADGFGRMHHGNYSPVIGGYSDGVLLGCVHGVDIPPDTPPNRNFLSTRNGMDMKRMAIEVGVDSLGFLSVDGMLDVYEKAGINRNSICLECVSSRSRRTRPLLVTSSSQPHT